MRWNVDRVLRLPRCSVFLLFTLLAACERSETLVATADKGPPAVIDVAVSPPSPGPESPTPGQDAGLDVKQLAPKPGAGPEARRKELLRVDLRNRSFIPKPNIKEATLKRLAEQAKSATFVARPSGQRATHYYLQFDRAPTLKQRHRLASRGARLLQPLGGNTWVSSVEDRVLSRLSGVEGLVWIGIIEPEDKIDKNAQTRPPLPYQLRKEGRLAYIVLFHKDVDQKLAEALVDSLGARIEEYDPRSFPQFRRMTLNLAPSKLDELVRADIVSWVQSAPPPDIPDNALAQVDTNVANVQAAPFNLSGAGVSVGVWEAGGAGIFTDHLDFGGRATMVGGQSLFVTDHATHVSATIIGDGSNNQAAAGMAPSATIVGYHALNDFSEMAGAASSNGVFPQPTPIQVSNHSYGLPVGWSNAGDIFIPNQFMFGQYDASSQSFDQVVWQNGLVVVKSAGNDRNNAWDGTTPVGFNSSAPGDCFQGGLLTPGAGPVPVAVAADCIGPKGVAKNVITVGATNTGGTNMAGFSSVGPTDDGRIKPDLVAPGQSLISAASNSEFTDTDGDGQDDAPNINPSYRSMQGTSMAAPVVTGIVALLMEQANDLKLNLRPSSFKAILVQTAQDVGAAGPDFLSGWGRVDAEAAIKLLTDPRGPGISEREISQIGVNGAVSQQFCVPPNEPFVRVTLAWDDPPAAPNDLTPLVNNLDLSLVDPAGTTFSPWTLNPAQPLNPATQGVDAVNNVEQVLVNAPPTPGVWTVTVSSGAGNFGQPPQVFSVAGIQPTVDSDNDSIADCLDNCPGTPNIDQSDTDVDGIGDSCDSDRDNDNVTNAADNCPYVPNPNQVDSDDDGRGDACDVDDDNDCVADTNDNCPTVANCNYFGAAADRTLCTDPCRASAIAPLKEFRDRVALVFSTCLVGELDPKCLADGCPWPEFERGKKIDTQVLLEEVAKTFPSDISGIEVLEGGNMRPPVEAYGFNNGELVKQTILDGRGGLGFLPPGATTPDSTRASLMVSPGKFGPGSLGATCDMLAQALYEEVRSGRINNPVDSLIQCEAGLGNEAAACQLDSDRDGKGDACEPMFELPGFPLP